MKRYRLIFLGLLQFFFLIRVADAAPRAIECRDAARLIAPTPGAIVSGAVEIRGRAVVADFRFYKVEYAPLGQDKWTLIGPEVIFVPVENGQLVTWQSPTVADGSYRLRLQVVDKSGNYCEAFISSVVVANRSAATETPAPTDTPIGSAVSPGPTATPRFIFVPTIVAPPTPSAGLNPRASPVSFLPDLNLIVYGGIVGLGNPGTRYARNRHNIGFLVADELARAHDLKFARKRFNARLAEGAVNAARVLIAKPQKYMNASGDAVGKLFAFYKIAAEDLLIIYDDLDLPLGKLRLRADGSAGGHHGMESIIAKIGTADFPRLRVGIGRPTPDADIDHVLGNFADDEEKIVEDAIARAVSAIDAWLGEGIVKAMNKFN
ncbi:MAG: aminoacyl-tRNA hydrolase [Chloroflexi bacterium]|nr:aminoacyl-tRNA hydrolase [Chloroflexota bacterium]